MKRLLFIPILFICLASFGQYTAVDNGRVGRASASDIPTAPTIVIPPTPEPEWEDTVEFDKIFLEDWQDFPITNVSTATSPNGIPNDTMAAYFENFYMLGSDDANDPDKADNVDIIMLNDYKVLRSWYPEGQCCTGAASDSLVANGGTGVDVRGTFTDPVTYITQPIQYYLMRIQKSTDPMGAFVNPKGVKQPGMGIIYGSGSPIARTMLLDYSAGTSTDPAFYTYAYYDDEDYSLNDWDNLYGPVANTKTMAPDTWYTEGWHLIAVVINIGTAKGDNGWMHLYIDGKLIDDGSGGGTLSSIPFRNSTTPAGFARAKFSTFAGGDTDAYTSSKDQAIDFGPYWVITMDSYDTTPAAGQDIYVPEEIKTIWLALLAADGD